MGFTLRRKSPKVCVLGLDGVPYSMLTSFMEAGVMPNARAIAAEGAITPMTVTLPEISSVSWSSFMTGKNPGEHGIFGFTELHPLTYKQRFPNFRDLKVETMWDRLGAAGKRSVVINQPSTYPARPIPGVLVSGFVAIQLEKAVSPSSYLKTLQDMNYEIDLDFQEVRDDPPRLFRDLETLLDARRRLLDAVWDAEKWHLMEVVVTGTDRLHHFAWDAYADPNHPHHNDFLDYYRKVDAFIGHVYEKFSVTRSPENFFMLSDHGFCGAQKEVHINTVLAEHGFLSFNAPESNSLEDISQQSTAFALDPARIYIHRRGRYAKGCVDERDVAGLKAELTSLFDSLHDGGRKIVRRIFDGAEAYSGPETQKGPDLLLVPNNGYDLKGRPGSKEAVGERRLQGMHTWDDAFFLTLRKDLIDSVVGANEAAGASADGGFNLLDTTPMILASFDGS